MPAVADPIPNVTVVPLNEKVHDCGEPIPMNETVDGYTNVKNTTCTHCQDMCEAPTIDATIKFFDGMDKKTIYITYGVIIGFTILY